VPAIATEYEFGFSMRRLDRKGRAIHTQPGNTFRITFRHANGQATGTIDVYQDEAEHFSVELEAIAAFLRAALIANKNRAIAEFL
jgi:hypothetical protein